jgi:hypothetical protein
VKIPKPVKFRSSPAVIEIYRKLGVLDSVKVTSFLDPGVVEKLVDDTLRKLLKKSDITLVISMD